MSRFIRLWHLSPSVNSNMHAQLSTGATHLTFGQTLHLLPYFMCANSKGSGETAWMRSLAWAFTVRLCSKYHNLMSWLKWQLRVLFMRVCLCLSTVRMAPHMLTCPNMWTFNQISITSKMLKDGLMLLLSMDEILQKMSFILCHNVCNLLEKHFLEW